MSMWWSDLRVIAALTLGLLVAGCEKPQQSDARQAAIGAYDYPGSVLWFSADHDDIQAPGDRITAGRENALLPPTHIQFDPEHLSYEPGKRGQAACLQYGDLRFVMNSEELEEPLQYTVLTFAFWINPGLPVDSTRRLFSSDFTPQSGLRVLANPSQLDVLLWDRLQDWHVHLKGPALPATEWSHVALTINASDSGARHDGVQLYVNGKRTDQADAVVLTDVNPAYRLHGHPGEDTHCVDDWLLYLDPLTEQSLREVMDHSM
ncbi:MAG: LamG domain-containing protein [Natronospirillum sp.]|uniref:LamG-like jellyroll fold domain-containing protein n=1 Tax=Natronospirillum sp. TaxID=2812955 RepID=UPI0025CBD1FC|nr:LamG-like jellyroll fold domain-containing protein [Natronospirillum sp.]MCH8550976.1 LamG domain-containing protein [Natronospirillum sp.]